jgi:hypothetical protein
VRSSILGALALATAVCLGGCSSAANDSSEPGVAPTTTLTPLQIEPSSTTIAGAPPDVGATSTVPASAADIDATTQTSVATSPLDALAGHITDPTELIRRDLEGQQKIAQCMTALGWEYTPVFSAASVLGPQDAPLGSIAFGVRYGYGVVARYELASGAGPLLPTNTPDPNQPYLDSLTQAERAQYEEALHGTMSGEAATGGCDQEGLGGPRPVDTIDGLYDRIEELRRGIRLDPRMQASVATWLACVTTGAGPLELAGRPVSEPSEMMQSVEAQLDLARGLEVYPIDLDNAPADLVSSNVFADGTWYASVGKPQPVDPVLLDKIRADEVRLWAIDSDCRSQTGLQSLMTMIENELVAQLQSEFPELQTG